MSEKLRRKSVVLLAAALLFLLAAGAVLVRLSDGPAGLAVVPDVPISEVPISAEAAALPAPQRPAFELGYVHALPASAGRVRFAALVARTAVRARPSMSAPVRAILEPRTSLGTTNVVLVIGHARLSDRLWVKVRFPGPGADGSGWLSRDRIGGYHFVRTRLQIDLRHLSATLLRDGRPVFRAPVAVGAQRYPTPRGSFYIREKLTNFDDSFYGPVAYGTSARSEVLTDWPDGGSIGIHGTDRPELVPGRVSHGCIRLRNEDILRLSRLMPVGTPVTIT